VIPLRQHAASSYDPGPCDSQGPPKDAPLFRPQTDELS